MIMKSLLNCINTCVIGWSQSFRSNLNILVSIKFMIEGSRPYMTELGHENYWLHRCVPPACHQRGGMRDESNNNISHDYYNDPGTIQHIWTHVHLLNENCRKQINLLNVLLLKIGHSGIWNSWLNFSDSAIKYLFS